MPQWDDDLYLGPASPSGKAMGQAGVYNMSRGIGPAGRVLALDFGNPPTANPASVCAAQSIAGAGNALINGSVSSFNQQFGQRLAVLNFFNDRLGQCLQAVSTNVGDTTQSVLVTGRDIYGMRMSQRMNLNGTTPVLGTKCFKFIDLVSVSASMAGSFSLGTRDAFGFPIRIVVGGWITHISWGNVYGPDPGTAITADTTDPASSTTNDVRGFYIPSSAADGVKGLTMVLLLVDGAVGPFATRKFAFGVTQA